DFESSASCFDTADFDLVRLSVVASLLTAFDFDFPASKASNEPSSAAVDLLTSALAAFAIRSASFFSYFSGFSWTSSRQPVQQTGKLLPLAVTVIVAAPPVTMHLSLGPPLSACPSDSPSLPICISVTRLACGAPGAFWSSQIV